MNKFYSVSEAAKTLGYSNNTIYSFLKKGELGGVRIGKGKYKISQVEIDKFLTGKSENRELESRSLVLSQPRTGMSLAEISNDQPLKTIILWLQERVGLPKLFDWLVGLSSIVLGISMFLYTKQLDSLLIGRYAVWFSPIQLALICGGVGLIIADMLAEKTYPIKNINNLFRYLLVVSFLGLGVLQLSIRDVDGFLINGLFALIILVEALFGVLSSTAYMFYIQGLLLGTALIFRIYPADSGLSSLSTVLYRTIDGASFLFSLFMIGVVVASLYGYLWNKVFLKIVLGLSGVLLVLMSIFYANSSYWARAFFVLIAGMVGMILPFWEQFKRKTEEDRSLVFRMFGTILMAFSLAVLVIGAVQTILINDGRTNLMEKTEQAKIFIESEIDDAASSLDGLVKNKAVNSAISAKRISETEDFLMTLFKNHRSFSSVTMINTDGSVIATYPFSGEISKYNFSKETFFKDTLSGQRTYISRQVEEFGAGIDKAVMVAVPVTNLSTDRLMGIAVVSLSAEYLSDRAQVIAVSGEEQTITMVDAEGKWIIHPETEAVGAWVSEADATFDLWKLDNGLARGYDREGRYSLFVEEKSKTLSWAVVASQPLSTMLDVSQSGLVTILFMLLVASVTVAISYISRVVRK